MTADDNNEKEKKEQEAKEREQRVRENSAHIFKNLKLLIRDVFDFVKESLSIKEGTNYEKIRISIIDGASFKGHRVYILIAASFIASIGLNLNSQAIIIGAMVIAPLLGPILGVGLAFGTNDAKVLMSSLKYFGVMVFIVLIISTLYFLLTPLVELQPELLERTSPTLLEIIVAIFGGMAAIVVSGRNERAYVIPGVAVATALLPPLSAAGYGIATGNWAFFIEAFYFFMVTSIFICVSVVIGVRYLGFPMMEFVNPQREKNVKTWMAIIMFLITVPSLWIFYGVVKESLFNSQAEKFVKEVVVFDGARMVDKKFIYSDSIPTIELLMIGRDIPGDTIELWKEKLLQYGLKKAKLDVYGVGESTTISDFEEFTGELKEKIESDMAEQFYTMGRAEVKQKDERIQQLEKELARFKQSDLKMDKIAKEMKIQFENLEKISYAETLESSFEEKVDTIPTVLVKWKTGTPASRLKKDEDKIRQLIQLKLELDTVRVITY